MFEVPSSSINGQRLNPLDIEQIPDPYYADLTDLIDPHDNDNVVDLLQARALRCVRRLGPLEREIIILRYGLNDEEPLTYAQIGARVGKSRSCIYQKHQDALEQMRTMLEAQATGRRSAQRAAPAA